MNVYLGGVYWWQLVLKLGNLATCRAAQSILDEEESGDELTDLGADPW
jgi:hypothetical protein